MRPITVPQLCWTTIIDPMLRNTSYGKRAARRPNDDNCELSRAHSCEELLKYLIVENVALTLVDDRVEFYAVVTI